MNTIGFEGGPQIVVKARAPKVRPREVIEALQLSKGLKTVAARRLGCSYATVKRMCEENEAVRRECEAQLEAMLDTVQLQMIAAASRGDIRACEFVLKTLGRHRGFSERHEVTGKDGGPIEHAHIHVWEEHLQRAHARIAAHKEAIRLERSAEGVYERPAETA